jgi:hypothetical protein
VKVARNDTREASKGRSRKENNETARPRTDRLRKERTKSGTELDVRDNKENTITAERRLLWPCGYWGEVGCRCCRGREEGGQPRVCTCVHVRVKIRVGGRITCAQKLVFLPLDSGGRGNILEGIAGVYTLLI